MEANQHVRVNTCVGYCFHVKNQESPAQMLCVALFVAVT
jgi:hypothetical protein